MDLFNEIQELTKKLSTSINQMAKYGKELAEAECDYKITVLADNFSDFINKLCSEDDFL